jgi:hypothetical protein
MFLKQEKLDHTNRTHTQIQSIHKQSPSAYLDEPVFLPETTHYMYIFSKSRISLSKRLMCQCLILFTFTLRCSHGHFVSQHSKTAGTFTSVPTLPTIFCPFLPQGEQEEKQEDNNIN